MENYKERMTANTCAAESSIFSILTGSLPDDQSIFSELGINFGKIISESISVFDISSSTVSEEVNSRDVVGPALFLMGYTLVLIVRGKMHHSSVYLLTSITVMTTYTMVNIMCGKMSSLSVCETVNALGYSFLPIFAFSCLRTILFFSTQKLIVGIGLFASIVSGYKAMKMICRRTNLSDRELVVFLPIFLCYFCYVLISSN